MSLNNFVNDLKKIQDHLYIGDFEIIENLTKNLVKLNLDINIDSQENEYYVVSELIALIESLIKTIIKQQDVVKADLIKIQAFKKAANLYTSY